MTAFAQLRTSAIRIVQDDVACMAAEIHGMAGVIADRLIRSRPARVALCSARADVVLATICGCEKAGIELLLLRRMPGDAEALHIWGVDAVIQEDRTIEFVAQPRVAVSEFAILLTTSGTTGAPKVARHSLEALLGRVRAPTSGGAATWLLAYHPASFAGLQVLLTAFIGGNALVACASARLTDLAEAACRYGATHISATPTFWRAFMMALGPTARQLPLRQASIGGESVDQGIIDRLSETFPNAGITHIYASTEAGALFAVRDRKAGFPAAWLEAPIDGVALRVVDDRLQVRSPRAMRGYLQGTGPDVISEDGWLDTGDRVEIRGDRVMFVGRQDAMINVGGAKVSPDEVEAVLLHAPGVSDAIVTGVRSPMSGHVVCAELIIEPGRDPDATRREALAFARLKLEPYQVPRLVRVVDSIKYSDSGKKGRT